MRPRASLGLVVAGLAFLVMGAFLGALNRGIVGLVVGGASGALLGAVAGAVFGGLASGFERGGIHEVGLSIVLEDERGRFAPGEDVDGYLRIRSDQTYRSSGAIVYFLCRGFFAHDAGDGEDGLPEMISRERQYLRQEQKAVPAGVLRRTACATYPFHFRIPAHALPTHHGYACSVRWSLHGVLGGAGEEEARTHQEIFVEANPPPIPGPVRAYQTEVSTADCQLVLILPRAICAEGETIEARVHFVPFESIAIRMARVLLLRIENTPQGTDHTMYIDGWDAESGRYRGQRTPGGKGTTYVWLEDEVVLTEPGEHEIGHPLIRTVELTIPVQWRPTVDAPEDGSVMWKVAAIVSRDDKQDVRAFHEVIVHTGVGEMTQVLDPEKVES
jgi:hypothetical protein